MFEMYPLLVLKRDHHVLLGFSPRSVTGKSIFFEDVLHSLYAVVLDPSVARFFEVLISAWQVGHISLGFFLNMLRH